MNSSEILDAVKRQLSMTSDYALSKHFGVRQMSIIEMRKRGLSEARAVQCAKILEIDPGLVMAWVHAERATDDGVRKVWEKVSKVLKTAAAAVFLLGIVTLGAPSPTSNAFSVSVQCILCQIQAWARKRRQNRTARLASAFLALFFLTATPAFASPWAINLAGASYHTDRKAVQDENLNEKNTGIGVRYYLNDSTFAEAGAFKDSIGNTSKYVGIAYQLRAGPFAIGAEPVIMSRPNYIDGHAFIAALPFASFTSGPVVTTITYTPRIKINSTATLNEVYAVYWSVRF